ncbi:helix-turn-helix domain-containing protein [Pantoea dispersa]
MMNSFTRDLVIWIENNLERKVLLEDVSVKAGYSKWYLQRLFRAETGLALASYIRYRKLSRAAILLKMTSLPVTEITYRLGFSTQQAFTRTFKQHFGQAPGRYREAALWSFEGLLPELTGEKPDLPHPQLVMTRLKSLQGINLGYTCTGSELENIDFHTEQRRNLLHKAREKMEGHFPAYVAETYGPAPGNSERIKFSLTFDSDLQQSDPTQEGSAAFLRFPFHGTPDQLTAMKVNIYRHIMPFRRESRRAGHDFFIRENKAVPADCAPVLEGFYYIPV